MSSLHTEFKRGNNILFIARLIIGGLVTVRTKVSDDTDAKYNWVKELLKNSKKN